MSFEVLQKYHIRAKKSLGQNFLVDENILESIATSVDIQDKNIVEVGPGYGALTERLLGKDPQSLTLVELDRDMVSIINERISFGELVIGNVDFSLLHQDVLQFEPNIQLYHVIANIPYYITSPILRHFLYDIKNAPQSMLILMQKDVGDKILRKNKGKSSVLSLIVEKKSKVSEKILVPKESFIPQPKVESSVLLFETHNNYSEVDDEKFLKIIKIGFSEVRKKLISNLVKGGFEKDKIQDLFCLQGRNENMRAEEGDIEFWIELVRIL